MSKYQQIVEPRANSGAKSK